MKKILLFVAIVAISMGSAFAQEKSAEKLRWKGTMNNGFWSNWEISVGGGVNTVAWEGLGTGKAAHSKMGWQVEGSLTKWYNPIVGSRLSLVGGELSTSDTKSLRDANSNWFMPTVEGIVNLSNWIGGYREDRVYYAKVFTGFGVSVVDIDTNSKTNEYATGFAATAGLINTFRVCKQLDINLELKNVITAGRDLPAAVAAQSGKLGQIGRAHV